MTTENVELDGHRYAVRRWRDQTSPSIVALHGFTGDGLDFSPIAEGLLADWWAPDLPGHGSTSPLQKGGSWIDEVAVAVSGLVERSGARWLLGYSMGGRVALAAALCAEVRARLNGLILIGATPGIDDDAERAARVSWDDALAERIAATPIEDFLTHWQQTPIIASQANIPAAIREPMFARRRTRSAADLAAAARGLGTGRMRPLWSELPALDLPVTLVTGGGDAKYGAVAERMVAALPQGEHVIIDGVAHCAHLEAVGQTLQVLGSRLTG